MQPGGSHDAGNVVEDVEEKRHPMVAKAQEEEAQCGAG